MMEQGVIGKTAKSRLAMMRSTSARVCSKELFLYICYMLAHFLRHPHNAGRNCPAPPLNADEAYGWEFPSGWFSSNYTTRKVFFLKRGTMLLATWPQQIDQQLSAIDAFFHFLVKGKSQDGLSNLELRPWGKNNGGALFQHLISRIPKKTDQFRLYQ